jgi:hypothetical protein
VASIGDRETSRAPALLKQGAMHVAIQTSLPLRERLSEQAARWREQANTLPAGHARQELLRKARQTDVTAHLDEWLRSPGLQPPK